MKRNILSAVLTLYCLLPIAAQTLSKADSLQIEIAQLENAQTSIQTDLQEKTLQYNWEITEKYIEYCKKTLQNHQLQPRTPVDTTCHYHKTGRTGTSEISLRKG